MENEMGIIGRCPQPECALLGPQPLPMSRAYLVESLAKGEVTVYGHKCNHKWQLSRQDMDNARKALADGLL